MNNERLVQQLQKTGLSEKAALVYTTLLQMGGAYPSTLSEATHLNRSTVYKILLDLSVKNLVTEIQKGKKLFYQIEKPEKLIRFSRNRAEMAQEAYEKTKELIPELEGVFSLTPNKPTIRYFQDAEGIVSIYEDMVSEKKKYEMVSFSHGEAFKNYLPPKKLQDFVTSKARLGITTRGIVPDTPENRKYSETVFAGLDKKVWPQIRFVPKEIFPFEAEITTYGENKLAITKLRGEKLIGIVIEDKLVHDMIEMIFNLLWKSDQVKE